MLYLTANPATQRADAARRRPRRVNIGVLIAAAVVLSAGALQAVGHGRHGAASETSGPFSHFPH